ncbi:hypothetical protein AAFF39_00505 [Lactococcus garvieae]
MIEYVEDYIKRYYAGEIKFNRERVELAKYIKREIEPRIKSGEIYFDTNQIEGCIGYIERWFFPLDEFQKFIISFVFLYFEENNRNVYRKILIMIARGMVKTVCCQALAAILLLLCMELVSTIFQLSQIVKIKRKQALMKYTIRLKVTKNSKNCSVNLENQK